MLSFFVIRFTWFSSCDKFPLLFCVLLHSLTRASFPVVLLSPFSFSFWILPVYFILVLNWFSPGFPLCFGFHLAATIINKREWDGIRTREVGKNKKKGKWNKTTKILRKISKKNNNIKVYWTTKNDFFPLDLVASKSRATRRYGSNFYHHD